MTLHGSSIAAFLQQAEANLALLSTQLEDGPKRRGGGSGRSGRRCAPRSDSEKGEEGEAEEETKTEVKEQLSVQARTLLGFERRLQALEKANGAPATPVAQVQEAMSSEDFRQELRAVAEALSQELRSELRQRCDAAELRLRDFCQSQVSPQLKEARIPEKTAKDAAEEVVATEEASERPTLATLAVTEEETFCASPATPIGVQDPAALRGSPRRRSPRSFHIPSPCPLNMSAVACGDATEDPAPQEVPPPMPCSSPEPSLMRQTPPMESPLESGEASLPALPQQVQEDSASSFTSSFAPPARALLLEAPSPEPKQEAEGSAQAIGEEEEEEDPWGALLGDLKGDASHSDVQDHDAAEKAKRQQLLRAETARRDEAEHERLQLEAQHARRREETEDNALQEEAAAQAEVSPAVSAGPFQSFKLAAAPRINSDSQPPASEADGCGLEIRLSGELPRQESSDGSGSALGSHLLEDLGLVSEDLASLSAPRGSGTVSSVDISDLLPQRLDAEDTMMAPLRRQSEAGPKETVELAETALASASCGTEKTDNVDMEESAQATAPCLPCLPRQIPEEHGTGTHVPQRTPHPAEAAGAVEATLSSRGTLDVVGHTDLSMPVSSSSGVSSLAAEEIEEIDLEVAGKAGKEQLPLGPRGPATAASGHPTHHMSPAPMEAGLSDLEDAARSVSAQEAAPRREDMTDVTDVTNVTRMQSHSSSGRSRVSSLAVEEIPDQEFSAEPAELPSEPPVLESRAAPKQAPGTSLSDGSGETASDLRQLDGQGSCEVTPLQPILTERSVVHSSSGASSGDSDGAVLDAQLKRTGEASAPAQAARAQNTDDDSSSYSYEEVDEEESADEDGSSDGDAVAVLEDMGSSSDSSSGHARRPKHAEEPRLLDTE